MKTLYERIRQHPVVQRHAWLRQFVKFGLVGVINTITSASVYLAATRLADIHPLVANAMAFVVAVTVSFILNKRWTFRNIDTAYTRQYSQFFLVSAAGFGWSEILIWFIHVRLGYSDLLAFGLAVLIVMFWNFGMNRAWTFRNRLPPA